MTRCMNETKGGSVRGICSHFAFFYEMPLSFLTSRSIFSIIMLSPAVP